LTGVALAVALGLSTLWFFVLGVLTAAASALVPAIRRRPI
jgi:hypothetical protein